MNQAVSLGLPVVGAGLILIQPQPAVPFPTLCGLLLFTLLLLSVMRHKFWQRCPVSLLTGACFLAMGILAAAWQLESALQTRVPMSYHGKDISLTVRILSVVDDRPKRQVFVTETVNQPAGLNTKRWRIAWYGVPKDSTGQPISPTVNDVWTFMVRVRTAKGGGNPGGFDATTWNLRSHINGTGYVRDKPAAVRIEQGRVTSLNALRHDLAERLISLSPNAAHSSVVVALTLGLRSQLNEETQALLVNTGTAHLLAISGLHIGLVSAASFFMFAHLWAWFPKSLGLRVSKTSFACIFAVIAALGYAALAGLSAPTLRAAGMCAVAAYLVWQRGSYCRWTALLVVLNAVVLTDVFRLLSPGVWLSFGTVALIMLLPSAKKENGKFSWWSALRLHTYLGVCLLPVTGWFFAQGAMVAPLANALAVPWVSLVVVPLSLVAVLISRLLPNLAALTLDAANVTIEWLLYWLVFCAELPGASIPVTVPSALALIAATAGVYSCCSAAAYGLRRYALVLCLPVLCWSFGVRSVDGVEVHVLDVGQGHASLILTARHTVLVDTGGKLGNGESYWHSAIEPALQQLGRHRLTHVVISHSDADHAAGLNEVIESFPNAKLWLGGVTATHSQPDSRNLPAGQVMRCEAGQEWVLDGVHFSFLHPAAHDVDPATVGTGIDDNDASCVLLVQTGRSTVLFPGDIEHHGEAQLLQRSLISTTGNAANSLLQDRLTVLVAPHHGSRTSSTEPFVQALHPRYVVFPAAHRNRSGFPHEEVLMRYKEVGSVPFVTGLDGALRFSMDSNGLLRPPTRYWVEHRRVWH